MGRSGTVVKMRPNQLEHIYRQYKHDTEAVVLWLASTAQTCGYPEALLASKSWDIVHSKLSQLKGKNRKKTQRWEKPLPLSAQQQEYILALDDLLPLAKFISQRTNTAVAVPDVFSETIDRLISLRTRVGQMKVGSKENPDPISDHNHSYFVGILKDVKNTLQPLHRRIKRSPLPRLSRRLLMRIF